MKASKFEGQADAVVADNWMVDIQVILNIMRLGENEKVMCASFMLRKDARLWWETVQIRWDVNMMTWVDVQEEFR